MISSHLLITFSNSPGNERNGAFQNTDGSSEPFSALVAR